MKTISIVSFICCVFFVNSAQASTVMKSFDGYGLEYTIDYPESPNTSRVVVLIHGSGQHDMDEDLGGVSAPGTKNLFFADVSSALVKEGFAVIRYNKRSYQWQKTAAKDPAFVKSKGFKKFTGDPLKYFVEDAAAFVKFAANAFPKAKLCLLGHSEGSYVALQVADGAPAVAGAALIGFTAQSLDISQFEQTVYRPLHIYEALDSDKNSMLDTDELKKDDPAAKSIAAQMVFLDLNKNGALDREEFMAGNLTNILLDAPSLPEYRRREASYKKPAAIIKDAKFNIAFFQGELDNQAPAYNARAIQLMNDILWKKPNLHFHFFPGLGHALDKRTDYHDLVYRPADPQALAEMAAELNSYWK